MARWRGLREASEKSYTISTDLILFSPAGFIDDIKHSPIYPYLRNCERIAMARNSSHGRELEIAFDPGFRPFFDRQRVLPLSTA